MSESNVELARRGWEAALRGEEDAIRDLLDPDVKWHGGDPSAPGSCRNRDEALEFMRRVRSRSPRAELVDVLDAGEKVVVITRGRDGGDGAAEPSANITTFRDGKAIEMVHYPNVDDALAAAGLQA
jgi:ketosteroid isomerase-like protein